MADEQAKFSGSSGFLALRVLGVFVVLFLLTSFSFVAGYYYRQLTQMPTGLAVHQPAISLPFEIPGADTPLAQEKYNSSINIVSVTSEGGGSINQANVEIIPGDGRILLSIDPLVEPDTQSSFETAAKVAESYTGKSLSRHDLLYSVSNTDAQLIGGPSAGVAFTTATIAAIEGRDVRGDAAITGVINSDGTVGQVGGVLEKATAAAREGIALFVVPKGQNSLTFYQPVVEESRNGNALIKRTHYVSKTTGLQQYLNEQGYQIEIKEAANINDAVNSMIA